MARYFVTWEIDIDADSAVDAARQALAIQRNPDSIATVFDVIACDSNGDTIRVDITELDESPAQEREN